MTSMIFFIISHKSNKNGLLYWCIITYIYFICIFYQSKSTVNLKHRHHTLTACLLRRFVPNLWTLENRPPHGYGKVQRYLETTRNLAMTRLCQSRSQTPATVSGVDYDKNCPCWNTEQLRLTFTRLFLNTQLFLFLFFLEVYQDKTSLLVDCLYRLRCQWWDLTWAFRAAMLL